MRTATAFALLPLVLAFAGALHLAGDQLAPAPLLTADDVVGGQVEPVPVEGRYCCPRSCRASTGSASIICSTMRCRKVGSHCYQTQQNDLTNNECKNTTFGTNCFGPLESCTTVNTTEPCGVYFQKPVGSDGDCDDDGDCNAQPANCANRKKCNSVT